MDDKHIAAAISELDNLSQAFGDARDKVKQFDPIGEIDNDAVKEFTETLKENVEPRIKRLFKEILVNTDKRAKRKKAKAQKAVKAKSKKGKRK